MGVRGPNQLQALEASALLHDTGKLAIPEHILNKPGKLTTGEFEKMKEHASVGAEILSSIQFPYPVVPIVRHHHENWDGTGYPDGLKGIEIPVGARILAVVDCFDALTSDRPYRPAMSDEDAVTILLQRRGAMYDPLIVDTFVSKLPELTAQIAVVPEPAPTPASRKLLLANHNLPPHPPHVGGNVASALDKVIRRTSASLAVVFAADRNTDKLVSIAARTASGELRQQVSIPIGYGVSGWVAANGKPALNAEAALDFQNGAPLPKLVRTLCVPIRINGGLAGVISLYTDDPRGFNEEDRGCLEELSTLLENDEGAVSFDGMLRAKESRLEANSRVH
jgi:putative nucleotidyltransferase with HDIG domain